MTYQASHDVLTGLLNRRAFEREVTHAVHAAHARTETAVLFFLDLDQFKVVNDTCGHRAGDDLLRGLAGALRHRLRSNDVVARLGGDEFGVLLRSCPLDAGVRIAEDRSEEHTS